jgi:cell division protein FtsB
MTEKRFTIKPQDDLFGVVDNYSADKVCVINGIRTEIEAKWLCKDMNNLNDENEQLKHQNELLSDELEQCKAVINKKWSEYLKKKEEQEND